MSSPSTTLSELRTKFPVAEHEFDGYVEIVKEQERREREAVRLYEPLDWQKAFHDSVAKERVAIAANQDGKSLCAYVELVRAVTGEHPLFPKNDGVAVIVGYDEKFIGLNPYRYLFKKGAFKIIRDETTGKWEAWKPWIEDHKRRKAEAADAPALLPKRFIKQVSWLKKKDHIFSKIELKNGWVILAFGSKGDEVPGFQADFVLFDEDIDNPRWYDEMVGRLTIRQGRLIWAALPKAENDALLNLMTRAEAQVEKENPTTQMFRPSKRNPYIDEETWRQNAERWLASGQDVYEMRALGIISLDNWMMYPGFDSRSTHNGLREEKPNKLQKILLETKGVPPKDWARFMVMDPGHTVCAVLFLATPPPEVGDFRVAYKELYLEKATAELFGQAIEREISVWNFEDFLIDAHGGRLTEIGTGKRPREHYEEQLRKRGIQSNRSGFRFNDGCDDPKAREMALRDWLMVRTDSTPTLYVVAHECKNLCREMKAFKKKKATGTKLNIPSEDGQRGPNTHVVECLEYAAAHGCAYSAPQEIFKETWQDRVLARLKARDRRLAQANPKTGIILGAIGHTGA